MKKYRRLAEYADAFEKTEAILSRWVVAGRITENEIHRVFNGDYYYFVTFIGPSPKGTFNAQGYGVITNAKSLDEAEDIASEHFDGWVDRVTPEWEFEFHDEERYPAGELVRVPPVEKGGKKERVALDV